MHHHTEDPSDAALIDPVCGMGVDPGTAAASRVHEGRTFYFCSTYCAEEFDANPAGYVKN